MQEKHILARAIEIQNENWGGGGGGGGVTTYFAEIVKQHSLYKTSE